ncbi:oxidoreductase [Actinoplanes lobatus]|uniref:Oxidoreductase n=1 Tax=Actinoplanes lobatus TaxID=113568 RepID=A0A7W7HQQ0_9ACTN|nr:NADH-quinone oxidoreductase subunit NuoF family protein [Actinoplanes lobatus]MBB4754732.1 NADH:ubiquinone oxidoreductase subunit F (NADH-binding)/ferredoxin [Actinoplanes lobatus]GGN82060.1 oxidoreductase [Actinoplanes lobatus]GIE43136.1 oxidoreductase [Actinoplanes lobatus]
MSTAQVPPVTAIGTPRITAGFDEYGRLDLLAHQEVHGGFAALSSGELIGLADRIELRGRGGAGFPFARKVRAVVDSCRRQELPPVIVVNATEGEPPSWKDKAILTRGPHLILDGAALAAAALDAEEIVIGVADDGVGQESLAAALAERKMPCPTRIVLVPHRFISGEGGALVRGINGEAHIPPGRKVRSSDNGVMGLPTLLSNAETYSQLAIAARLGPWEYNAVGIPEEPGTVMLTIGGSASAPAVVEAPTGTSLMEVLEMCGADIGPGLLVGGYHGKWVSAEQAKTIQISRKGFAKVGGTLGAGMLIPIGSKTCPVGEVAQVVQYLAGESAGQCGPCRIGLPDLARAVTLVSLGGNAVEQVRQAAGLVKGRGACSHPDGSSRFALSALEVFRADVQAHSNGEGCGKPVRGILPLPYTAEKGARKLALDWSRCDGHGLCSAVAPEIIRLDHNGFPAFPQTPLPPWLEDGARKAVNVCPALALRLTEPTTAK